MSKPYRILAHFLTSTGCDAYRSFLPFRHCHRQLAEEGIELKIGMELTADEKFDAYIFHRHMSADFIPPLYAVKKSGAKIVWDLDDNLFEIPESNPAHQGFGIAGRNSLLLYLEWADFITCSAMPLGLQLISSYGADPNKVAILPNLIDPNDWPYAGDRCPNKITHVMWAGSASHKEDLEIIIDPIKAILEKRNDVRFTFVGMVPKDLLILPPERCAFLHGCEVKYYPQYLASINADISLAPLVPGRFNEAKSNIKWMESTMAGAAVVASDIITYSDSIENERTGILCKNEGWEDAICLLLDNPGIREDMKENARKTIIEKYSWSGPDYEKWMSFFRHLANTPSP